MRPLAEITISTSPGPELAVSQADLELRKIFPIVSVRVLGELMLFEKDTK